VYEADLGNRKVIRIVSGDMGGLAIAEEPLRDEPVILGLALGGAKLAKVAIPTADRDDGESGRAMKTVLGCPRRSACCHVRTIPLIRYFTGLMASGGVLRPVSRVAVTRVSV
jgi:hypothetical protein